MREDTIAAIATPVGEGGIAVIRISGERSIAIAQQLAGRRCRITGAGSHTVHHAWLRGAAGTVLDEALVSVFRAPRTYTGEDVVEIGLHGSTVLARRVLGEVLQAGARLADRGEFTRRALTNGRLDVARAEAVIDLVRSKTERGADAALRTLAGAVSKRTIAVEEEILQLLARLEVNLDFVEDVASAERHEIAHALSNIEVELSLLEGTARRSRRLREGATVVLVGEPNVGKSSLFNALLDDERALVSPTPGTTRDWIEAWIEMQGIPVRLIDTAGVRQAEDPLEAEGVVRSRRISDEADLLVLVRDATSTGARPGEAWGASGIQSDRKVGSPGSAEAVLVQGDGGQRVLEVLNKGDLANERSDGLLVSARTGHGLETLRRQIAQRLLPDETGLPPEDVMAGEMVEASIRRAVQALRLAREAWARGESEEVVANDLRAAAESFGTVTGKNVGEEVLDRIFSKFCIGK